jgi:hypothetical protein
VNEAMSEPIIEELTEKYGGKPEWIELPVEFKGMWVNAKFGGSGMFILLRDRFNPEPPPDRLRLKLIEMGKEEILKVYNKDHQYANPAWIDREWFEKAFGKVLKIYVNKETWNSDFFITPNEDDLLIVTEDYIVFLWDHDHFEYFKAIPKVWEANKR